MDKSKVAIVKCKDYDPKLVYRALRESLDLLGGIAEFIKPNQRVLLKPNLLSQRPADTGVNTNPEFVRAAIKLVREAGGVPIVGDSPGGSVRDANLVYEKCGVKRICDEEKCELVKFEKAISVQGIPIAEWTRRVDLIVNLPKAKTHNLTIVTGAVKNLFGCVCGLAKVQCHLKAPDPTDFAKILVDIYEELKPAINLMDAVVAMEGEGPAYGSLRQMGTIIASKDAVALDAVFCHIIGLNPFLVPTLALAHRRKLGTALADEIEVLGEKIKDVKQDGFQLPSQSLLSKIPKPLLHPAKMLIKFKTAINEKACRRCGLCEESCPVGAIKIGKERCTIDYHACIRCMCCFEVCPYGAVILKRSLIARALTRKWVFKRGG